MLMDVAREPSADEYVRPVAIADGQCAFIRGNARERERQVGKVGGAATGTDRLLRRAVREDVSARRNPGENERCTYQLWQNTGQALRIMSNDMAWQEHLRNPPMQNYTITCIGCR
jgi:hypothetical protein